MSKPTFRKVYGGNGKTVTPRVQTNDGKKFREPSVEEQYTKEELENLWNSIRFTQSALAKEAAAKYDEEEENGIIKP